MASRSLNKVFLIGNLTKDPELRYTPQGTPVCSMGLATNRTFVTDGEKREEAEFHRLVAWTKLAELCAQLLKKGMKIHVEGRLQTRNWQTADGQPRTTTEIVIEDMMILTPKGTSSEASNMITGDDKAFAEADEIFTKPEAKKKEVKPTAKKADPSASSGQAGPSAGSGQDKPSAKQESEDVDIDDLDIPF